MIRMTFGSTSIDGVIHSAGGGAFHADEATEKRLVSLGVAVYAKETATPSKGTGAPAAGNPKAGKNAPKGKKPTVAQKTAKGGQPKKDVKTPDTPSLLEPDPAGDEEPLDDGDTPPELGAEEPEE